MQAQGAEKNIEQSAADPKRAELKLPGQMEQKLPEQRAAAGVQKLDRMELPGLPVEGPGVLTRPSVERQETLRKAIAKADAATPSATEASRLERFSSCLSVFSGELRKSAASVDSEYYSTVAAKVDALKQAVFKTQIPQLGDLKTVHPEIAATVLQVAAQADKEVALLIRDLAENHSLLFPFPSTGNAIAVTPVVLVEGKLEFKAEGLKFPICLYNGPGGETNGCHLGNGLTLVNLAKCEVDKPGGEQRVKTITANELAHAYLMQARHFPPDGELKIPVRLGSGPEQLDAQARAELGALEATSRNHIHELVSDHWSTTVDQRLDGEVRRMLSVALWGAVVEQVELFNGGGNSQVVRSVPGYKLTSTIMRKTLESIERSSEGRIGWVGEVDDAGKIAIEMEKTVAQQLAIVKKLDEVRNLLAELAGYLQNDTTEKVLQSLGSADREKILAAVSDDTRAQVLKCETKLQTVIGKDRDQIPTFIKASDDRIETLQSNLVALNEKFEIQITAATERLIGKLNKEDRAIFRGAIAHYAKRLIPTLRPPTLDDLKIPTFPLPTP